MHAPSGIEPSLVSRLHADAQADRWKIAPERFEQALAASLANARAGGHAAADAEQYCSSLHLQDLALAVACADGHDAAWELFVAEYRAPMNRAAQAIDPAGGTDLADSLYAELFGLQVKSGERQSLFRYFHGRCKLGTWLRAILSQRHVDRIRSTRRNDPLPDEESGAGSPLVARESGPPVAERGRFIDAMREALSYAIGALAPNDRLRLRSYYAGDMTLAAIGRMLGEHEATASRNLTRTRREVREAAEARLRHRHGLDDRALAECFQSVTEDAGALDLAELFGADSVGVQGPPTIHEDRKNGPRNRSRR